MSLAEDDLIASLLSRCCKSWRCAGNRAGGARADQNPGRAAQGPQGPEGKQHVIGGLNVVVVYPVSFPLFSVELLLQAPSMLRTGGGGLSRLARSLGF
jgi:hypothetical protein